MPPLNALRSFEAAARLGGFVAAGEELSVTSAAISHQVKELERSVGVPLFRRLPRGVALTPAGKRYHERVAEALTLVAQATARLHTPSITGELHVSVSHSFALRWLAPRLSGFTRQYSEIGLVIDTSDRLADVRAGDSDIAIRFGSGQASGLHSVLVLADRAAPLVARDYLSRASDAHPSTVLRDSVLLEDQGARASEPWMTWRPWLRSADVERSSDDQRLRFSDSGMALAACESGAGLCIGRMSLAYHGLAQRQLVALQPWRSTDFGYYLIHRDADVDNPRVRAFSDWLRTAAETFSQQSAALPDEL